ncbi:hypothetical protein ACS5PN_17250 [Roseateles sp. NT4]|uniref:hypothetical protein n=1 Tax=Roseateles sp. NT4 TaxID=3453715 RepID=UPI003EEBD7D4
MRKHLKIPCALISLTTIVVLTACGGGGNESPAENASSFPVAAAMQPLLASQSFSGLTQPGADLASLLPASAAVGDEGVLARGQTATQVTTTSYHMEAGDSDAGVLRITTESQKAGVVAASSDQLFLIPKDGGIATSMAMAEPDMTPIDAAIFSDPDVPTRSAASVAAAKQFECSIAPVKYGTGKTSSGYTVFLHNTSSTRSYYAYAVEWSQHNHDSYISFQTRMLLSPKQGKLLYLRPTSGSYVDFYARCATTGDVHSVAEFKGGRMQF